MKNKVGIAIAAVAVVAIALAAYFFLAKPGIVPKISYDVDVKKEAAESLARYVPNEVIAYYSLNELEQVWNDLRNSKFWNEFTALNIWNDPNVQSSIQQFKDEFRNSFGFELGEGTLMDLLGKELALAVLPIDAGSAQPKVLFLADVGTKTKVTERIFKIVEKIRGEEEGSTIQNIPYGSSEIVQIPPATEGDPNIYYTILGNSFVLGIGETKEAIENAIDIVDGKSTNSLAENEKFRNVIRTTTLGANDIGRFYMDFDRIGSFMEALSTLPGGTPLAPNVATAFGVLSTLGGTTVLEEGLFTRVSVVPNRDKMDALTRQMWDSKPAKPESMNLIPEGTYLYSASCSLDVKAMWDLWLSNLESQNPQQGELVKGGIANFEQAMGINIEDDVLSWVGNEASFVFNEVATGGLFPIPKMALLVKVKNKRNAEKLMNKLVDTVNQQAQNLAQTPAEGGAAITGIQLQMTSEDYKGYELKLLELPFLGKALAPGYTFIGDFLVVSSNMGSLQKMIDTYKGDNPSLASDQSFQIASRIVESKTNQVVYVNMEKMMDAAIEISNWVASFQALQPDAQNAQQNQQFIQESLIPLLKTLKNIKVIGVNTLYTQNGIEQTFFADFSR